MERITHNLVQSTPEWHAFRADHFGASEASAAMGISPYMTRTELLHQKFTGETPEVPPALQAVFDRGHETEVGGRALAEAIIGEDLFPVTMSYGKMSASCDGLTMGEDVALEHKQWNADLAESLVNGVLPDHHKPQVQQVLFVTGAEKCLFMTSDGTDSKCAWMWVERDPQYMEKIQAAWNQFGIDLAAYVPSVVKAEPVAAPQETLPAVSVQVTGSIAIIDNLNVFGDALTKYVAKINQKPQSDDDFATLEAQVKILKGAEDALTAAENNALGQASDIDALRRAVAGYKEVARQARLTAEKVVKAEKENRKNAIIKAGIEEYHKYLTELSVSRFSGFAMVMPDVPNDFYGVVKSLRTLSSIQNAVNTELARVKIEASTIADKIAGNLKKIDEQTEYKSLFADYRTLAIKDPELVALEVERRITAAKAEQERKLAAERERIAAEERAKAEREARAKLEAEQREAAEKLAAEQKAAANTQATPVFIPVTTQADKVIAERHVAEALVQVKQPAEEKIFCPPGVVVQPAPLVNTGAINLQLQSSPLALANEVSKSLAYLTADELNKVAHYIERLMNERAKVA